MSSRVSPISEARRTVKVRDAINKLDTPSSVGRNTQHEVVTHRCRVFRLDSKAIREGTNTYTVVWDTLERPFKSGNLPQGEVYFATSGISLEAVENEVESLLKRLGSVVITDWNAAGSI